MTVNMKSDCYKWLLLAFLFVTFFLELGTRQVYNAVLPQLMVYFAAIFGSAICRYFKNDYIGNRK